MVVNLTGRKVVIRPDGRNPIAEFPPARCVATVVHSSNVKTLTLTQRGAALCIPLTILSDEVKGLPPFDASSSRKYLVMRHVASAAKASGRPTGDLYFPADLILGVFDDPRAIDCACLAQI